MNCLHMRAYVILQKYNERVKEHNEKSGAAISSYYY